VDKYQEMESLNNQVTARWPVWSDAFIFDGFIRYTD
jgi:hypothetical protein